MLDSVTKFLERVDAKAGEIAQQREALAAARAEGRTIDLGSPVPPAAGGSSGPSSRSASVADASVVAGTASGASPGTATTMADRAAPTPAARAAPLPSVAASSDEARVLEAQVQQRDQALLRLQGDYQDLASRARDIARELERKIAEAEDAAGGKAAAERRLQDLLAQQRDGEGEADALREQLEAANAALADAQAAAEQQRQEREVERARVRQWEQKARQAEERADDERRRANAALGAKENELAALRAELGAARADAGGSPTGSGSPTTAAATERLAAAEARVTQLLADVARLKQEADTAKTAADTARRELTAAQRRAEDAVERARVAQAMYDGEVSAHASSRGRLEAALKDAQEEARLAQRQSAAARGGSTTSASGPAALDTAAGGATSSTSSSSSTEWERRAKELAELVVEKQAALEAKRSEVEQWKARCEAAQQRVRDMELLSLSAATGVGHRAVNVNGGGGGGGDDARGGGAGGGGGRDAAEGMLGEFGRSQFFGNLSRRGKWGAQLTSAARHIDGLSLHAGRVLNRSSVLRVIVILYVVVLQVWAFLAVALTSVPEAGSGMPEPPK